MKKTILASLLTFFTCGSFAQNFSWGNSLPHTCEASTILPNGDIIVVGGPGNSGSTSMSKISNDGTIVWTRAFGSDQWQFNITSVGFDLYLCANIIGQSEELDIEPGIDQTLYDHTGNSIYVAKLDSSGNANWINTYPGGTFPNLKTPNIAVSPNSGKIAVVGSFFGTIDFNPSSSPQGEFTSDQFGNRFVLILENNGTYANSWLGPNPSGGYESYTCCSFDSQDNVFAGGYANSNGSALQVEKFASNGTVLSYLSPSAQSGKVKDLIVDDNDFLYITGEVQTNQFIKKLSSQNLYMVEEWSKLLPSDNAPYWRSIKFGPNNSLILAGLMYTNAIDLTPDGSFNETISAFPNTRPIMVNYSASGDYISHRFLETSSSAFVTTLDAFEVDYLDSTVVLVGKHTAPYIDMNSLEAGAQFGGGNGNEGYVVRWDFRDPSTASIDESLAQQFQLFPNPATSDLKISNAENATVSITDLTGKKVMIIANYFGEPIDINELLAGVYILNIEQNGAISTKRFIKN